MMIPDIEHLVRICLDHPLPDSDRVVVSYPYIPWVPSDWNGILVLAEAQNLSKTNADYRNNLRNMLPNEQVRRLHHDRISLGIEPWDDGSLKLAVDAALDARSAQTAVSNGVLWSQVTDTDANQTPSDKLVQESSGVWSEMLPVLQPMCVVSAGKKALAVVEAAKKMSGCSFEHIHLRLPSTNNLSRISGMFSGEDLLRRFPEVARVTDIYPDWVAENTQNKIFFACHAVSMCKGRVSD